MSLESFENNPSKNSAQILPRICLNIKLSKIYHMSRVDLLFHLYFGDMWQETNDKARFVLYIAH